MTPATIALMRAVALLTDRIASLEVRARQGEESAWEPYQQAVTALALVLAQLVPERHGGYLTTAQMAERLGVSPKTLLRRKSRGELRPALQRGKLLRWRTEELAR